jgi:chromosome segregation ATPase
MMLKLEVERGDLNLEQRLEKLTENIDDIKGLIKKFNDTLENIEQRLARLEKMDSIEHRVEVNQIDLSDIKESLERIEETQGNEIKHINLRLDSHLVKIAKVEEEIIIMKSK